MNSRLQISVALALIGLSTVAITHPAQACGLAAGMRSAVHPWVTPAYMPGSRAATVQAGSASPNALQAKAPITGMYQFTQTAEGNGPGGPPDGALIDQTWHADGTELMNSGRNAASGNFCMGVWAKTGPRAYELNHYALAWDPTGQVFVGPANIRENVTLSSDGNSLSGDFDITQYAPDGTTILAHVQGVVAATRITVDSN